jgi:hypothetical protein
LEGLDPRISPETANDLRPTDLEKSSTRGHRTRWRGRVATKGRGRRSGAPDLRPARASRRWSQQEGGHGAAGEEKEGETLWGMNRELLEMRFV